MKKTYIEPANIVVRISTERIIALSPINATSGAAGLGMGDGGTESAGITEAGGRESISAPDAWEEW